MTLRVLIVDDEQPARDRLEQLLSDEDEFLVAGKARNGAEAIEHAADADIVLLDIRMPGMSGLETAKHINRMQNPPAIVFTTAYDEYAIEAFEARAVGYVLKPVRRERLRAALEHAKRLSPAALDSVSGNEKRQHVCARRHGELRLIPIESVHCFQADQKYTSVHHDEGQDLIDEPLKSLEEEFSGEFVRIHRSAIVSVSHIDRLEKNAEGRMTVVLRNGTNDSNLLISRRHLADVRRRLTGV